MTPRYLVVVSDSDPVARGVSESWGTPPSVGLSVDGAAVRALNDRAWVLRRPGPHVADEHLDHRLPAELRDAGTTLVFPSIHRSEQDRVCLTVHPLGNPGPSAEIGGAPRTLVPTDPGLMAAAVRALAEGGPAVGLNATFEATHHGPTLDLPAMFVEIGYGDEPGPPPAAVALLSRVIPRLEPDGSDRTALAVGGGHYAPHFTDLVLKRRWAVGHILSRHALAELDASTARSAWAKTPGADGILFARAADAEHPALLGLGPRLKDGAAAARGAATGGSTGASRPAAGT